MNAMLLTWNPEKWPDDPDEREEMVIQNTSDFGGRWSTGHRKSIPDGTPIFLLAQGNNRGIVASGRTRGAIFQDRHWNDGRKLANYVSVDFTEWIPLDLRLHTEALELSVPSVPWRAILASGTTVDESETVALETLWTEHLTTLGIGSVRQPEELPAEERFIQGAVERVAVNRYERNPEARKKAIALHGFDCKGCGFNFEAEYGDLGKDYIVIHHLLPVSTLPTGYEVNPATDLVPLCANCHAMVHRENPPLKPEALRKRMKK